MDHLAHSNCRSPRYDHAFIKDSVYRTELAHRPRGDHFEMTPEAMFEMVRPD